MVFIEIFLKIDSSPEIFGRVHRENGWVVRTAVASAIRVTRHLQAACLFVVGVMHRRMLHGI